MEWSDEQIAKLREMTAAGESARTMADAIGTTRNAIISKARKLDIAMGKKPPPAKARRAFLQMPSKHVPAKAGSQPAPPALPPASPHPDGCVPVSFWDVTAMQCRWPLTDPAPISDFRFCGAPAVSIFGYCAHHMRIRQRG
jgi:GcrA cell cycle regulator